MPFNLTAQLNVQRKRVTLNVVSVKSNLLFPFSCQKSRDPEQREENHQRPLGKKTQSSSLDYHLLTLQRFHR